MLSYSKKSKCQGCSALFETDGGYTCALKFSIVWATINGKSAMPKPDNVKCYKPKSLRELGQARRVIEAKKTQTV